MQYGTPPKFNGKGRGQLQNPQRFPHNNNPQHGQKGTNNNNFQQRGSNNGGNFQPKNRGTNKNFRGGGN
jgi:hypothetical protein